MKKTIFQMTVVAMFVSALASCGNNQQSNGNATEDATTTKLRQYVITSTTDNPAIFLSLVNSTETDSSMIYIGKSLNEQDTLALKIEMRKDIPAGVFAGGEVNEENAFTNGTIKFSSLGAESDNFVQAMATLYEQSTDRGMTDVALEPIVFSSNKTVVDLTGNQTYAFKLSFANNLGEGAEMFAELNLYNRSFKLWSKDVNQYPLIISAFTGE